jgi:nicotinamide riboside transporter PnuC
MNTYIQIFSWIMASIAIFGTILNISKNRWCFIVWGISNLGLIILNLITGMYAQAVLFLVQLAMAIVGFVQWSRKRIP